MSNLNALALTMAILVAGQISIFWCARKLQDRADGIATGILGGVPVSKEHRGMALFNQWMPMQFFLAVYTALFSMGTALVAQNISSVGIRLFAYMIAVQAGISALGLLVLGGQLFFHLISVLRQAEAD
jgi:hypothetical protein